MGAGIRSLAATRLVISTPRLTYRPQRFRRRSAAVFSDTFVPTVVELKT